MDIFKLFGLMIKAFMIRGQKIIKKKYINERTMRDCRRGYLQNLLISTATCLMRPIEGLKQSHFHNKFVFQYWRPLMSITFTQ